MKLLIKNTIEDYRDLHDYIYNDILEKNKIIFNIYRVLLYLVPWGIFLVYTEVIINKEYFYIILFIIFAIVLDLLIFLLFRNRIKILTNLSLISIKRSKFCTSDKFLEINEEYIKIFNDYGKIEFNKKDRFKIVKLNKGIVLINKKFEGSKRFIFITKRSFSNNTEIEELINSINTEKR